MAIGPGKYGARAEAILRDVGGELCIVLVLAGARGPSFDIAVANPALLLTVPGILRLLADSIEGGEIEQDIRTILGPKS